MSLLAAVLGETWNIFLVAAPFLLIGLFCAGLLHVLLPRRAVERWMGQEGLLGVVIAACFGIPLPLCSCGVVPVAMALRRKGASRPASLSFLITTPESGVDSILLTYGMFGPVMAVARPLASFVTAVLAGALAIAYPDRDPAPAPDDGAGHGGDSTGDSAHVVGPYGFWHSLRAHLRPARRLREAADGTPPPPEEPSDVRPFPEIMRDVSRYAFVELADDIVFWLVLGLFLAGAISALLPGDLSTYGLGSGIVPMLVMLAIGVPLYACASASTPVAAALVAKGLSPGAALVFLLSGPATNAATVMLLARHFGRGFVRIYLGAIAVATLACGILLDWVLATAGWQVHVSLSGGLGGVALIQWLSAVGLAAVFAWRLWAGAGRSGVHEVREHVDSLLGLAPGADAAIRRARWQRLRRIVLRGGVAAALLGYLASGVRVIPPDGRGYCFLFGRLAWADLPPGIHYVPPAPFGRCDAWRVRYARMSGVGFRPDLQAFVERRARFRGSIGDSWHSPVTATQSDPRTATYLTGDENLVEISFAIQYTLSDPEAFFYRVDKERDTVALYGETAARELVGTRSLDELLTTARADLEGFVERRLQEHLDRIGAGVAVEAVLVVDLHPPQDAVAAFRDVSSAREERETAINRAGAERAKTVPLARGQAALDRAAAQSAASAAATVAGGEASAFRERAAAFTTGREILETQLWLEAAERVLPGREKLVVPHGSTAQDLVIWKDAPTVGGAAPVAPQPRAPAEITAPSARTTR